MDRLIILSILRKLPLKLLLIILALFWIFAFCFSSADSIDSISVQPGAIWNHTLWWWQSYSSANENWNVLCIQSRSSSSCNSVQITFFDWTVVSGNPYIWNDSLNQKMFCTIWWNGTFSVKNTSSTSCEYFILRFAWWNLINSTRCQTEYNLIPINSVDQNYCTTNNLCPSQDCPSYTWDLTPWVSNIFINDIFHPWAFNVIINIPEEIDRDYAYTNSWSNFNLDVVWYNQDTEYINWLIDINN